MMSGQNGSRQVIEAILAGLAQVALSVPLAIVMAVTPVLLQWRQTTPSGQRS
jgi:hypothetical protein